MKEKTPFPKISAPAERALLNARVVALEDLAKHTEAEIVGLHGMGPKVFSILIQAMKSKGISFKKTPQTIHADIKRYNATQSKEDRKICELLSQEIFRNLPKAENKIWHRHPVWFLDGNPIVGYAKLKDSVQLLFWSGQSFDEKGLEKEGSFKAAQIRYTEVSQVNKKDLTRWLKKAKDIQWDYKNIVKRKGRLERIK